MDAAARSAASQHRARLFPLPLLAAVVRPPCTSSARVRFRFRVQRTIAAVTNRSICALNRLYSSPIKFPPSQPDKHSPFSCSCCRPSASSSAAQLRVLAHLRERCASFVLTARTWATHHSPACDISPSVLDMLVSIPPPSAAGGQPRPPPAASSTDSLDLQDSLLQAGEPDLLLLSPPLTSAFSSAASAVVPLIAERVSLPEHLNIVPLLNVLPKPLADLYAGPSPVLLRSSTAVLTMDFLKPLRKPRVAGSRAEYVRLVARMQSLGMLGFTATPKAVNGVFTVGKDRETDRLIIDAQPANRYFVDSPHVDLPNPSHLVQMAVPAGVAMFAGKSDMSNFYHHLGVPAWMQPYLALPPLTPAELASIGLPAGAAYPMCLTTPMGWSHAVFLAQAAHEHVVYSSSALRREDSLLCLTSAAVSRDRALHGIVIDDLFLFTLDRELAERIMQRVFAAYRAAGFVVKQSKVVMPTSAPVKIIGFDVDGSGATIRLPVQSQISLAQSTLAVMRAGTVTGTMLSHLVGRWTWVMMLRRCSLAVLQHAYRYCRVAQYRRFTLWPSVRRELSMLLSLLPLLEARLDAPFFHRAIASDASELAGGVVAAPLTAPLQERLWPLCSSRRHAVHQALANAHRFRLAAAHPRGGVAEVSSVPATEEASFDSFYGAVSSSPWRTIVAAPWWEDEHINVLELRAALLAVHWALSFPSALSSRVFLLLDSSVAFFSLWKGRSSSPALLLVLRKISALLLAGGLSLLPGWVPSAVNPADAPSRLQPDACPLGRFTA
jgi:hypothetical protein